MATQVSLNSGAVASAGVLALQTNGTTEAIGISTGQVATLAQNPILTSGTASGVAYLSNPGKVLTTGSALTFDGTNLGVGVTPSAWSFGGVLQSGRGSWYGDTGGTEWGFNTYYNAGYKYIASSVAASKYQQAAGAHNWFTAASGTAGNAINFTQAMTLDASGRLMVGTTTPGSATGVMQTLSNSSAAYTQWSKGNSGGGLIGAEGTGLWFYTYTGNIGSESYTERARIDSSGNLIQKGVTTASGVKPSALANNESISTVNSATYTITLGTSAKLFWIALGNGDAALVFTSYLSSSIIFLGITPNNIVASASPTSAQLGISKSANSHDIVIKTGSALASTAAAWQMGVLSSTVA